MDSWAFFYTLYCNPLLLRAGDESTPPPTQWSDWRFIPCGPKTPKQEYLVRMWRLSPAQALCFSFLKSETFLTTFHRMSPWRGVLRDALPIGLFHRIHLGTHFRRIWDIPNIDTVQANQNEWPKKLKEMPHKHNSNYHAKAQLRDCLSECVHVFIHTYGTLFLPNKYFTGFTTFSLCGNSFLQSLRARALSLA